MPVDTEQLRQWFDSIDIDRNGALDPAELQRALALNNLRFSQSAVARMIRIHDSEGKGTINFQDFRRLHIFLTMVQENFSSFDTDRRGQLSYERVCRAMQESGYRNCNSFHRAMMAFDPSRSGMLDLSAFIMLNVFMQSVTSIFRAFDKEQGGNISLDYDQFIYVASELV